MSDIGSSAATPMMRGWDLADRSSYRKKKPDTPFRGPAFIDFIYPFPSFEDYPVASGNSLTLDPPILNERDNRAKKV